MEGAWRYARAKPCLHLAAHATGYARRLRICRDIVAASSSPHGSRAFDSNGADRSCSTVSVEGTATRGWFLWCFGATSGELLECRASVANPGEVPSRRSEPTRSVRV